MHVAQMTTATPIYLFATFSIAGVAVARTLLAHFSSVRGIVAVNHYLTLRGGKENSVERHRGRSGFWTSHRMSTTLTKANYEIYGRRDALILPLCRFSAWSRRISNSERRCTSHTSPTSSHSRRNTANIYLKNNNV